MNRETFMLYFIMFVLCSLLCFTGNLLAQEEEEEDEGAVLELETITIKVTVEQPGVSIIPNRVQPEFEELSISNKSFKEELKTRFAEIIVVKKEEIPVEKMDRDYIKEIMARPRRKK